MLQSTLQAVGLKTPCAIPADELFSNIIDTEKYQLSKQDQKKLQFLKAFLEEFNKEISIDKSVRITDSKKACDCMKDVFNTLSEEQIWIVLLDKGNKPISKMYLNSGTLDSVVIDNRKIIEKCLLGHASSVILYHNHPSGFVAPGTADIKATEKLRTALSVFEIALLDHIIVGKDRYYSFAEEKETIL